MASLWVTAVLMFLFALTLVAYRPLLTSARDASLLRREVEARTALETMANRVVAEIDGDTTPGAQSVHDRVFAFLRSAQAGGRQASLEDLSSNGGDYAYLNVNAASVSEVVHLLSERSVDPLRVERISALMSVRCPLGPPLKDAELRGLLGQDAELAYPLLSALPGVNVNFASEGTIRGVLESRCPESNPSCAFDEVVSGLLTLRQLTEVSRSTLSSLLARFPTRDRILAILGVRTWCWKVTVADANRRLVRVVSVVPGGSRDQYVTIGEWVDEMEGGDDRN